MPSQHIWTEKDRHGTKREVRATKFGGVWCFQSNSADDEWRIYLPALVDLLKLTAWNTDALIAVDPPSPRLRRGFVRAKNYSDY
jgi:hypothetical protein